MFLSSSIISTVLGWDISNLKKRASQIEKIKDAPSAEQLSTLREYVHKDREEQERCRTQSSKCYFLSFSEFSNAEML